MTFDIIAITLGIVSTLCFGLLALMAYQHHRQQALRFWERERRLPDATRFENLKFLNEQEETKLQELRDQLFDARNTIDEAERQRRWMEETRQEVERMAADKIEISRIQAELETLQGSLASFNEQKLELETQLAERKQQLETTRAEFEKLKDEAVKLEEANRNAQIIRKELESLTAQRDKLISELDAIAKNLKKEEEDAQRKIEKLQVNYEEQKQKLLRELKELNAQSTDLKNQIEKLKKEMSSRKQELDDMTKERNSLQKESRELQGKVAELKGQMPVLQESLATLSNAISANGGGLGLKVASDLWVPKLVAGTQSRSIDDEAMALNRLSDHLEAKGLRFHRRTLNAFHTSLKTTITSPLVVLAGVSGTGKSELPRRYAEALGINFLNIAVQPRWDSPQDLFGFYDYLEQRFRPTDLTRALIQMDPFWSQKDRGWDHEQKEFRHSTRSKEMLLVLLDEMNLARVEYYFSEFLSRLETRRGISIDDAHDRQKSEITLDVGGKRGAPPMQLFVGRNVLFVGTMNEDETTQSLSDKVIDRANILRFGSPATVNNLITGTNGKAPEVPGRLSSGTWTDEWVKPASQLFSVVRSRMDEVIVRLRESMDKVRRPFAYRVSQGMLEYAANYPDPERNIEWIISDQIEQKILPRLRGIDPTERGGKEVFGAITQILKDANDELLIEHVMNCQNDNYFQWIGLDRAREAGANA